MVRLVAEEFLTDERDRKYYADNYRCCPPPLFILLITIFEVSFNFYKKKEKYRTIMIVVINVLLR